MVGVWEGGGQAQARLGGHPPHLPPHILHAPAQDRDTYDDRLYNDDHASVLSSDWPPGAASSRRDPQLSVPLGFGIGSASKVTAQALAALASITRPRPPPSLPPPPPSSRPQANPVWYEDDRHQRPKHTGAYSQQPTLQQPADYRQQSLLRYQDTNNGLAHEDLPPPPPSTPATNLRSCSWSLMVRGMSGCLPRRRPGPLSAPTPIT